MSFTGILKKRYERAFPYPPKNRCYRCYACNDRYQTPEFIDSKACYTIARMFVHPMELGTNV